jgi:hypothetical protein
MYFSLAFLAFSSLAVAQSDFTYSIAAHQAVGTCSPTPATGIMFNAKTASPGVQGIYVLPQTDYAKLVDASAGPTLQTVDFQYYVALSCQAANTTACNKDSGMGALQPSTLCVAFVNSGDTAVDATLSVLFTNNPTPGGNTSTSPSKNTGGNGGSRVTTISPAARVDTWAMGGILSTALAIAAL